MLWEGIAAMPRFVALVAGLTAIFGLVGSRLLPDWRRCFIISILPYTTCRVGPYAPREADKYWRVLLKPAQSQLLSISFGIQRLTAYRRHNVIPATHR